MPLLLDVYAKVSFSRLTKVCVVCCACRLLSVSSVVRISMPNCAKGTELC